MNEPIFNTEVKSPGNTECGALIVSLMGLNPHNYEDKLLSHGLIPVSQEEYRQVIANLNTSNCDLGYDILICVGELITPSLNRRSCLAFHKSDAKPNSDVWEMPIFCTYHNYFYSCDLHRSYQPDEPEERRWIVVKKLNTN